MTNELNEHIMRMLLNLLNLKEVNNINSKEEFITTLELCEWLKVAKSTVSKWRSEGLPHYGKTRVYRYKKSEVLKWLDGQQKRSR